MWGPVASMFFLVHSVFILFSNIIQDLEKNTKKHPKTFLTGNGKYQRTHQAIRASLPRDSHMSMVVKPVKQCRRQLWHGAWGWAQTAKLGIRNPWWYSWLRRLKWRQARFFSSSPSRRPKNHEPSGAKRPTRRRTWGWRPKVLPEHKKD